MLNKTICALKDDNKKISQFYIKKYPFLKEYYFHLSQLSVFP